jgi:multidrug efflux system membrane fusion protein
MTLSLRATLSDYPSSNDEPGTSENRVRHTMNTQIKNSGIGPIGDPHSVKPSVKVWAGVGAVVAGLVLAAAKVHSSAPSSVPAQPLASVAVSTPLQRDLDTQASFLGQYSAVEKVELRAQVGGTLTEIHFKDGDIVGKGDLLFVIDPEPYQIRMSQAQAQLEAAKARLDLATHQLVRAQTLKATDAGSTENVEQRVADKLAAQAALDGALAQVHDARFDLEHTRISAPFTGRIGNHQVSVGNLVAGSRGGVSPTTLLTTMVSLDPIYLDFDMSEADYNSYLRDHEKQSSPQTVGISRADSTEFTREGKLDFIDNALDRSSGTIHARAVVANNTLQLTPGGFARVRLSIAKAAPVLLVPDAAVLPDQSSHFVLTVAQDGTVSTKQVEVGDLRGGLRVIRSGLTTTDRVVIDSIPLAHPGAKVAPHEGQIRYGEDAKANSQQLALR